MENDYILSQIKKYYISPEKFPNESKREVERSIGHLNRMLIQEEPADELLKEVLSKYTTDSIDFDMNRMMYQSISDKDGFSTTKGYREIYFNEIIQNANDNTRGDTVDITVRKLNNGNYQYQFEYEDAGFEIKDIMGFLTSELHTKGDNLKTTGKHGVGIKSLFYFVDKLEIYSNVIMIFERKTKVEEGEEKVVSTNSSVVLNEKWSSQEPKTKVIITFPDKFQYANGYHVKKLKDFADYCNDTGNVNPKRFFQSDEQTELIFDARNLIFTDKNKRKESGIKKLIFRNAQDKEVYRLECINLEGKQFVSEDGLKKADITEISINGVICYRYLVIMLEGDEKRREQNFTVAFPCGENEYGLREGNRRYYETYYIPDVDDAGEEGLNILINSGYSSTDRTRLADEADKSDAMEVIRTYMNNKLLEVYRFLTSEENGTSAVRKEISCVFHKMLLISSKFIDLCYDYRIHNRYLQKNEADDNRQQYLSYQEEENELYRRRLIGKKISQEALIRFFEQYIRKEDAVLYSKESFMDVVSTTYERAIKSEDKKLRIVLNIAGTVKDLIYYRIYGRFTQEKPEIEDYKVDEWNALVAQSEHPVWTCNDNPYGDVALSLALLGRYGLNNYISTNGELIGASFKGYLFNDNEKIAESQKAIVTYPTMKEKQEAVYGVEYRALKERLLDLLVNKNEEGVVRLPFLYTTGYSYAKGTLAFYGSWDTRAECDTFYDASGCTIYNYRCCNTHTFGDENTKILCKKLLTEDFRIRIIETNPMLISDNYPSWGEPSNCFGRSKPLATGRWFTAKCINIKFFRSILVNSWEDFCFYANFLVQYCEKYPEKQRGKGYRITLSDCNIHFSDMKDIFKMYYQKLMYQYKNWTDIPFELDVTLSLEADKNLQESNQCPADYVNYLEKLTGCRVWVTQTNSVNAKAKELVYSDGEKILLRKGDIWIPIGKCKENPANQGGGGHCTWRWDELQRSY